jgi:hypothetical protein
MLDFLVRKLDQAFDKRALAKKAATNECDAIPEVWWTACARLRPCTVRSRDRSRSACRHEEYGMAVKKKHAPPVCKMLPLKKLAHES